jgi:hypothetical protein
VNRTLKKTQLRCEYLKLELEDASAEIAECINEFNNIFGKYYIKKQDTVSPFPRKEKTLPPKNQDDFDEKGPLLDVVKKEFKKPKLKKLYKKLSSVLHPDIGGDGDLFLKLKQYYDSNNLFELIKIANENNIDYDLDEDDINLMEKSANQMENEIQRIKQTLAWNWVYGDIKQKESILKIVELETKQKIDITDYPEELKYDKETQIKLLG